VSCYTEFLLQSEHSSGTVLADQEVSFHLCFLTTSCFIEVACAVVEHMMDQCRCPLCGLRSHYMHMVVQCTAVLMTKETYFCRKTSSKLASIFAAEPKLSVHFEVEQNAEQITTDCTTCTDSPISCYYTPPATVNVVNVSWFFCSLQSA
jgi:hypothetical protein